MIVRPATENDIQFILSGSKIIEQKSYDVAPNPLTADRLRKEVFAEDALGHIIVAETDGQLSGYMMYSFCLFGSEGEGIWVTHVYLDPFCQKGGAGRMMIEALKKMHPHVSGIYGSIARSNKVARHFFSSLGAERYDDYIIYGFENDWGQL